jgi:glyoxylase-like metal-dependent hydrolase (beta-lactamase superfamily II)
VGQSRIGGSPGESYAVQTRGGTVLIDPLPLEDNALEKLTALGPVIAIALTIQSHQRASWRYRQQFGVKVYAPRGAQGLDEKPDVSYRAGARLPGGLTAIALPGPAFSGHGFFWRSSAGRALFCGDLLTNARGRLAFVSDEYMDAPDLARKSARRLLALKIDLLCPGHGSPLVGNVRRKIAALLAHDRR